MMTSTGEDRFAGILGDDYKLLRYAYPHHDLFQETVADQISQYLALKNVASPLLLEGGCGSGVTSLPVLKKLPKNARLIGVDVEQKMLDQAKEALQDYLGQVELVKNDILADVQSRASESIDVFLVVWTLHNLHPDYRKRVFVEVGRVLKQGGLFISGDKYAVEDQGEHERQLEMQLNRFRSFADIGNPQLAEEWVKHNLEDDKIKMKESEQRALLQLGGFIEVKTVYRQDMEAIIVAIKA